MNAGELEFTPGRRYRERVADAILDRRVEIASTWLDRLTDIVQEDRRDVFPTSTWLDHVPVLIGEVANIVREGDATLVLRNSVVSVKAIELGELRHKQRASVHQILREYDLLAAVLEQVVRETTREWGETETVSALDGLEIAATLARVVRSVMQATVDTFIERYTAMIGQQAERLRSVNGFVAHELRTPLQSASLDMEMMLAARAPDDPERAEIERVQKAIERISDLLSNVETLVEPENDSPDDAVHQEVDLAAFVRDAAARQAAGLDERGVTLHVDDDLGTIVVDVGRLAIVLSNLIGNAIKYSDPGKPTRRVDVLARTVSDPQRVALVVRDNGLGIPASRQDTVFELRTRAHGSLDAAHGVSGHGFGLFLVAEAVREMGGTIALASEAGRWTEFALTLPKVAPDAAAVEVDRSALDALEAAAEVAPGTASRDGA